MWTFLVGTFGLGRIIAAGAIVASILGAAGYLYSKGYMSCAAKYELAQARAEIAALKRSLDEIKAAEAFGKQLAEIADKADKANEKISKTIVGRIEPGTTCIDPGFLRRLDELK